MLFICTLFSAVSRAQSKSAHELKIDEPVGNEADLSKLPKDYNRIYYKPQHMPSFPGGEKYFYLYLKKYLKLPKETKHIKGKVIVSLVVERDGSLTDINAVRKLRPNIDAAVINVIKKGPRWRPAVDNNRPVRSLYTVSVPIN